MVSEHRFTHLNQLYIRNNMNHKKGSFSASCGPCPFLRSRMTCIISLVGQWTNVRSQILFMSKRCPTCVCSCFESFNICLVIVIGLAAMANVLNGWKNDATCNKPNIRNAKNCNQSPDQSSVLSHNFCMPDTGHEGLGELGSSQFKLGSK